LEQEKTKAAKGRLESAAKKVSTLR
jgi:hypothetical protein